jgi:flagellar assembly factor FliW
MEVAMLVMTRHFGEIDLDEDKILYFEHGIMGFEDYKRFTILYDSKENERPSVSWLQSVDEPTLAIPVMDPLVLKEDYSPKAEDELLKPLGNLTEENMIILVSITVPAVVEHMTANLKAPFIINSDEKKGAQIIVENSDYEIRYPFYDAMKKRKDAREAN